MSGSSQASEKGGYEMWAIARLTLLETWRRHLLILTLILTGAFLLLYWLLAHSYAANVAHGVPYLSASQLLFQNYENGMMIFYLGLFFVYFMIAFFSIFSLSGAITGDSESGLLAAILPRPLHRVQFLFGKWVGFAIVQAVYVAVMMAGVSLVVHIVFPTVPVWTPHLLLAGAVFVLEAWTVAAVTLLGSVLFAAVANGIGVSIVFGIAFLMGSATQIASNGLVGRSASIQHVASTIDTLNTALSLVFPSDGLYRRALYEVAGPGSSMLRTLSSLLGPFGVGAPPSGAFVLYAVFYLVATLGLAAWVFGRRDL